LKPHRDLTVVKLGGSHAFAAHLTKWIDALAKHAGKVILVPGGGPFADSVRDAQRKMRFDDAAAHRMALLAMEQYACALASMNKTLALADSRAAIGRALYLQQVPVWLPARMTLAAREIPWSWDVTSDSLALWLAGKVGAQRLLLVKHGRSLRGAGDARELAERGIVDAAFPRFLRASRVPSLILGPSDHGLLAKVIAGEPNIGMRIGRVRRARMD
jgi:aspartokinase-like uncharacterized kinase